MCLAGRGCGLPSHHRARGFHFRVAVGISFFGGAWSEPKLLKIAYSFEQQRKARCKPEFLPTVHTRRTQVPGYNWTNICHNGSTDFRTGRRQAARVLKKYAMRLGRSLDNELAYPEDPWLSRYHLIFELVDNHWFVKDRESRNGTVVNANTLHHPHRLRVGDRIYAGHLTIEVIDAAEPMDVVSFVASSEGTPRGRNDRHQP